MWGEKRFNYLNISSCFYFLAVQRGPNLTTLNFRIHNLNKTGIFPLVEDLEEGFSPPTHYTHKVFSVLLSYLLFVCVCVCMLRTTLALCFSDDSQQWKPDNNRPQLSPCTDVCYTRLVLYHCARPTFTITILTISWSKRRFGSRLIFISLSLQSENRLCDSTS